MMRRWSRRKAVTDGELPSTRKKNTASYRLQLAITTATGILHSELIWQVE